MVCRQYLKSAIEWFAANLTISFGKFEPEFVSLPLHPVIRELAMTFYSQFSILNKVCTLSNLFANFFVICSFVKILQSFLLNFYKGLKSTSRWSKFPHASAAPSPLIFEFVAFSKWTKWKFLVNPWLTKLQSLDSSFGSLARTKPPSAACTILLAYMLAEAKSPTLPKSLKRWYELLTSLRIRELQDLDMIALIDFEKLNYSNFTIF